MSLGDDSLEWHSILDALKNIPVETARATLGQRGTVAYTDGACIQNPGGPAGWSVILASVDHVDGEHIREGAPRIECYGHIPESQPPPIIAPRLRLCLPRCVSRRATSL